MSNMNRNPGGTPTGGQFASSDHAEASVVLEPTPRSLYPSLYLINDSVGTLAASEGFVINDDRLDDLTHETAAGIATAHELSRQDADAAKASRALGKPVRPPADTLRSPLTPTEVALRVDENDQVTGYVKLRNTEIEAQLDEAGEATIGTVSTLGISPKRIEGGEVVYEVDVNVEDLIENYQDDPDELAEYEAARQYRDTLQ